MDDQGSPSTRGETPILSPTSDSRSSSVHERAVPKPRSPSPACIGKFGLRRSHSGAQRKNTSKITSSTAVEPADSIPLAEKANEPLGPRPSKRSQSKDITADGLTGSREGRQFTVGNVGQNGKIYLRPVPITNQAFHTRGRSQPPCPTENAKTSLQPVQRHEDPRYSLWSNSQMSDLRPRFARASGPESSIYPRSGIQTSESHSSPLSRRHSLSTIRDEFQPAPSKNRGELRIVIERPDTEGLPALDTPEAPSLSTPIPHYRLGGFRFTSTGTPMLRSSAYTRTSVSDNYRSSMFTKSDAPDVPPLPNELLASGTPSYMPPLFPSPRALSVNTTAPSPAHSSVFYKLKEPIEPSVFDHLTLIMDDPSVVRYAKGTKQVTAATPARIVAQISSESFMDYELVSDFFLTFRSYLSHSNLLSLLLARLQWAINRPEDDGRVIRIRVFAALRHWILNYFADDFVSNPDLRIQFCDRLNRMYEELKRRSRNSNSDLKILIDLKKCWNGRCSLYWDAQESGDGINPDDPVVPGGVDGSQDGDVSPRNAGPGPYESDHLMQANQQPTAPAYPFTSTTKPFDFRAHQTSPQPALENPTTPLTLESVQPHSCSLPNIMPRHDSLPSNNAELPHPVLLASPKLSSPMSPGQYAFPPMPPLWRRPMHAHKRSGSFSDSLRDDRAPLPHSSFDAHGQPLLQMMPHPENLIRGNVYGPPEPLLYSMGPPSPNFEAPPTCFGRKDSLTQSDVPKSPGPAVKTFIKSLQRALNTRPSGNNVGNRGDNPYESRGKTSPLPRNVSCRPDGYRGRKGAMHFRGNTRVDLLCEEAYLSYRKLLKESETSVPSIAEISEAGKESSMDKDMRARADLLNISRRDSIPSQMTRGSKSIVIVDDTRTGTPYMTGGLEISLPRTTYNPAQRFENQTSPHNKSFKHIAPLNIARDGPAGRDSFSTIFDPKVPESQPSTSVVHDNSSHAVRKAFRGLRKYASYDSVMTKHSFAVDSEHNDRSDSSRKNNANAQARAPMLRRRPGGDLRKMQNDLEPALTHKTISTDFTETSSLTSSVLQMAGLNRLDELVNDNTTNLVQYPQRYTLDESRHIRRSFEATVAGFAKIPDDDDGGIESTLLKLEGKWQKPVSRGQSEDQESDTLQTAGGFSSGISNGQHRISSTSGVRISSYAESEDSYCSIPLLERGLADDSMKSPQTYSGIQDTLSQSLFGGQGQVASTGTDPSLSIEMVEKTESMQQLPSRSASARGPYHSEAIPYDDEPETDDYASELSSEISIDVIDGAEANGAPNENGLVSSPIMSFATLGVPTHPLAEPPSPPMTLGHPGPSLPNMYSTSPPQKPLTPEFSPNGVTSTTSFGRSKHARSHSATTQTNLERHLQTSPTDSVTNLGHTPFILAYDSEILARQFAIVEQAALSEVDWKDLVDMRWSHSSQTTLNWVNYLAAQDRKGIDMVVARFNLMVKWAVSEIVLTTDRKLRASTITKLIHVAVHSRKIRNYATMLQVTIALCSVDCTRLVKTWELIPEGEKQLLREMESLIQPTRNFYNLRSEMETCNLQDGCIPFVGLYVQDLTYNAQKPAQIASTRDGEPLVNFERYRTAAAIVKSLLRLIDASTKYKFEPVYGLVERCLWIASLTDDRIIALSKELE